MTLVDEYFTEDSYARINLGYLNMPNSYYSITAINKINLTEVESEIIQICSSCQTWSITGSKNCVGLTYAYSLNLSQQNSPTWSITDPARIGVSNAGAYFDPQEGVNVPFYQAMDFQNFYSLPPTHPYRLITNGVDHYKKILISPELSSNSGPFKDAQDNFVTEGFLIEKKLDQFSFLNAYSSNLFNPSSTILDQSLSSWITIFNNGNDYTGTPPTSSVFVSPAPTQLTCNGIEVIGGGGPNPDGTTYPAWENLVFACWDDIEQASIAEILDCLGGTSSTGGVGPIIVTDVVVNKLSDFDSHTDEPQYFKMGSVDVSSVRLEDGLYEVVLFTNSQGVFNFVFEQKSNPITFLNENVVMDILNNPIINDRLSLRFNSSINDSATLKVFTLDSDVIYLESEILQNGVETYIEIPIEISNPPYNQIRIELVMSDGSKIVKTAVL